MTTIPIYDTPTCCSTGRCDTDIDPRLVNFDAMFSQLGTHGLKVELDNLGQPSVGFLRNASDVAGWSSSACSGNEGHEQHRGASHRSYFWR
jgi:hypothetical protein